MRVRARIVYFLLELSRAFSSYVGRRNKHGIPLRKLLIFGRSGLAEMRGWVKEWLKR
jgi:hypothetical protein